MQKINLIGKWYELEEFEENSEENKFRMVSRSVIQYFGNGKLNYDGHIIVARTDGKKSKPVETFCKISGSGEWELIDEVLYETLLDSKLTILEMFIGNIIVPDKSDIAKYEQEFDGIIPKGKTSESKIQSLKNEVLTYKQMDDEGIEKIKRKKKTVLSYDKYVEREL
jgi:hypothetical protein